MTEASIQRTQRFMWATTSFVFLAAVVSVIQRDWAWAVTLFAVSVVSVFMNRRAIRNLRECQQACTWWRSTPQCTDRAPGGCRRHHPGCTPIRR